MFLPFLSAILGIIAFLPVNFYPAGFVFLVPLFIFFLREQKFWRLIFGAAIFRLVFGLGTGYYTLEPIFWTSSLLIFLGLPASVFIVKKLTNFFSAKYLIPLSGHPLLFSLPFLWTFFDHLEARYSLLPTYIITVGNIFGSSPFLGLANFGGIVPLTFFAAIINFLIAAIIIKFFKTKFVPIAIIFIFIFLGWQISNFELKKNSSDYNGLSNSLKLAVVSVNEKFTAGQFDSLKKELAAAHANLVVFPEDMVDVPAGKSFFLAQNTAQELKTNLLAAFDTTHDGARYNSVVLFDKEGNIIAQRDKNRLTFIGEYWPFGNWRPLFYDWLKKFDPSIADYAIFSPQNAYRQGERKLLSVSSPQGQVSFAAPICLEINYPGDLAEYKKSGAKFIVNPSSGRWIKKGVKHFLYLTNNLKKIESVWLKIPIISSGVNDYAGVILPDSETRLVDYENGEKNYGIFRGEIRY